MIAGCFFEGVFLMALGGLCIATPAAGDKLVELILGPVGLSLPSIQPELGQLLCFHLAYLGVFYIAMGLSENRGFARFSVYSRLLIVPGAMAALAAAGRFRFDALFIAVPDAVFAIWTRSELGAKRTKRG